MEQGWYRTPAMQNISNSVGLICLLVLLWTQRSIKKVEHMSHRNKNFIKKLLKFKILGVQSQCNTHWVQCKHSHHNNHMQFVTNTVSPLYQQKPTKDTYFKETSKLLKIHETNSFNPTSTRPSRGRLSNILNYQTVTVLT